MGEEASDDEGGQGAGGGFRETSCVPVEPYGFIFDSDDRDPAQDVPLSREAHATYAPIASFYCGAPHRFADLPLPTSEDWEAATGLIFPPSFKLELARLTARATSSQVPRMAEVVASWRACILARAFETLRLLAASLLSAPVLGVRAEANFRKFDCAWEGKRPTALFRGTATGGGVTEATNQRLAAAGLSHRWKSDPAKAGAWPWRRTRKRRSTVAVAARLVSRRFLFEGSLEMRPLFRPLNPIPP